MTDIKKIIKGLECCQESTIKDPFQRCDECPYNEISVAIQDCRAVLSSDALEALKKYRETVNNAAEFIKYQPEIVLCKNCKHYDEQCQQCETIDGIFLPDFYCADGERKEGR